MNPINEKIPVFDNIFMAMNFIKNWERTAHLNSCIMPPILYQCDFFSQIGFNLDEDDFLLTRLACNIDDVEYYRMLNVDNGTPYLTDFKRYSIKPNLAHSNFLYRGQKKDYKSIKSSVFRDAHKGFFLDDMIKCQELSAFIAMHPLVQLLGVKGVEIGYKNIKLQANLYGLAQHYYNKTTLVDLSSSIDVAAFFAVTQYDSDLDKYFPIENGPESTGILYALPISKSLSYNSIYGYNITSIGKQYCFKRPERQFGFLADCSGGKDLISHKLLLGVRFKHNRKITQRIYESFGEGEFIAPSDPIERYWRRYRDIKGEPFLISNKAIELNLYQNYKESRANIENKLLSYRDANGIPMFRLTGKTWPEFPHELLVDYWRDIKNGWWQDDFCDNIYSVDMGKKSMEAFRNLPNDSRYHQYFFEH